MELALLKEGSAEHTSAPSALLALLGAAGECRPAGNEEILWPHKVRYLRLISNVTIEKKDVRSFPLGCLQTSIKQWCFS